MQFKNLVARIALGMVLVIGALACRVTDELIAQNDSTPTRTRTPRPTFTPIPLPTATFTPVPTVPPPPTNVPAPTVKPTTRPQPTATRRPPTQAPVVPPPTSPPPAPKFDYAAEPAVCTHAGNQYIKGKVYDSHDASANGVQGVKIGLGDSSGTGPWVTITSEWDGFYTFTLTAPGEGPKPAGTYYVWLLNSSGQRISDIGGPIKLNPVGPDAAGTCWAGSVDFWHR